MNESWIAPKPLSNRNPRPLDLLTLSVCRRFAVPVHIMSHVLVICILTALVEEPTKMIIAQQRASTDIAASMQKRFMASPAHMEAASMQAGSYSSSSHAAAAGYSFESMSATSMSAMVAESVVSMSSRSTVMEMSAHAHAESSLKALSTGIKRGEMTFKQFLNVHVR